MPPRSNLFQDVVAIIHRHLAGDCVVTESERLLDRSTGDRREVDVVIRTTVAGQNVVVCVEAAKRSRTQGAPWVEQQVAKHRTLPTTKLVLVSSAGFSGPALRKATSENVETITPEDLVGDDGEIAVMSKLAPPSTVDFAVLGVAFDVRLPAGGGAIVGDSIYLANGDEVARNHLLDEITDRAFRQALRELGPDLTRPAKMTREVHVSPVRITVNGARERVYGRARAARTGEHVLVEIEGVTVDIGLSVQSHPSMSLVAQRFDKTDVLYGETQFSGANLILVATETGREFGMTMRTREPGAAEPVDWELIDTIDVDPSD